MTWTYGGDPGSSDRDAVRLQIGDTDTTDQQLTDEEIDYFLDQEDSVLDAALAAVRAILALYARLVDKSVGDLRQSYSQRLAAYQALEARLKKQTVVYGAPVAGGISQARKDTVEEDDDRVAPAFARDQFSHPGTESSDNELESDS